MSLGVALSATGVAVREGIAVVVGTTVGTVVLVDTEIGSTVSVGVRDIVPLGEGVAVCLGVAKNRACVPC